MIKKNLSLFHSRKKLGKVFNALKRLLIIFGILENNSVSGVSQTISSTFKMIMCCDVHLFNHKLLI